MTTLDTAIRLARYLFEELWSCVWNGNAPAIMRRPLINTAFAVGMMLMFAYSKNASKALWPYFGAGNQLIGALTLTTVSLWLIQRKKTVWFTAIPALFMVATAGTALVWLVHNELQNDKEPMRFVIVAAGLVLLGLCGGFVMVAAWRIWLALRRESAAALQPESP